MNRINILFLASLTITVSCNSLLKSAYGIKDPKRLTDREIEDLSMNLEIPLTESFVLQDDFFNYLSRYDSVKVTNPVKCSPMISKYQQPLQVYYFNEAGELISFHNNCNTGGFPKLNWNNNNQFDRFVPATTIPITDTTVSLSRLVPFIRPLIRDNSFMPGRYTVVVLWSGFMKKQSKELFRVVRNNLLMDPEKNSKLYFVNIDNCFAGNVN